MWSYILILFGGIIIVFLFFLWMKPFNTGFNNLNIKSPVNKLTKKLDGAVSIIPNISKLNVKMPKIININRIGLMSNEIFVKTIAKSNYELKGYKFVEFETIDLSQIKDSQFGEFDYLNYDDLSPNERVKVQKMERSESLPAIAVYEYEKGEYIIIDGNHRYIAAKELEIDNLVVAVYK